MTSGDTVREISNLISDKEKFEEFVYTPLGKVISILKERDNQKQLNPISNLPLPFQNGWRAVLFRHVATPNYETVRFLNIVESLQQLKPLILEYTSDKFSDKNEWKRSLAKIPFSKGIDAKGHLRFENISIIDFNEVNGDPISSINTLWGQSLVEFHHELFLKSFPYLRENVFNLSDWLRENGQSARNYYKSFFKLFIKNGVLFENFLLEEPELTFNKDIVLPSIFEIIEETNQKPLIVSLGPTEVESNKFWLCHPYEDKLFVVNKVRG